MTARTQAQIEAFNKRDQERIQRREFQLARARDASIDPLVHLMNDIDVVASESVTAEPNELHSTLCAASLALEKEIQARVAKALAQ